MQCLITGSSYPSRAPEITLVGKHAQLFSFLCCFLLVSVLCSQCCQCLWTVHPWGLRDRMVVRFMQSVHITTNVVSSNPAQARCTRYKMCDEVCQ